MKTLKRILMSGFASYVYVLLMLWGGYCWIENYAETSRLESKNQLITMLRGMSPIEIDETAILLVSIPHDAYTAEYKEALKEAATTWARQNNAIVASTTETSGIYGIAVLIQCVKRPFQPEKIVQRSQPPGFQGAF